MALLGSHLKAPEGEAGANGGDAGYDLRQSLDE